MELKIIITSDGSHSLLNIGLDETYHSVHGAIQESQHVFIQSGLVSWQTENPNSDIRILEIGFGTGLNAFLTTLTPRKKGINVYYESWESFPLDDEVVQQLNYPSTLGSPEIFKKIHGASWDQRVSITGEVTLQKRKGDVLLNVLNGSFDLIFYDAFAPSKQPELWTYDMLEKMLKTLAPGGVLVTYCAKGQVKRDLKSLGLVVETLAGPPGKKEMIRARRPLEV